MKKILFYATFLVFNLGIYAQSDSGFGLKAGINYNSNGDFIESSNNAASSPEKSIGFHAGFFGKIQLSPFYIRPELVYTRTTSNYNESSLNLSKLDAPILLGLKIIGPVHIFAGPSFQYILNSEFDNISIDKIENNFSIGAQFGFGVNLGKLGLDLRYERGLNENEVRFLSANSSLNESRIDARAEQIILSLSVKL